MFNYRCVWGNVKQVHLEVSWNIEKSTTRRLRLEVRSEFKWKPSSLYAGYLRTDYIRLRHPRLGFQALDNLTRTTRWMVFESMWKKQDVILRLLIWTREILPLKGLEVKAHGFSTAEFWINVYIYYLKQFLIYRLSH